MSARLLVLLALAGCYDLPKPACGFLCGAGGACPEDYTCNAAENRCHLNGSAPQSCPHHDAGADAAPDAIDASLAPILTHTSPTANATSLGVTVAIGATFSEDVTGVSGATFQLWAGDTLVAGTVTYDPPTHTMAFAPDAQLAGNTQFTARFSSGITDALGLPLAPYTWTFSTGADTIGPIVRAESPVPDAMNVPPDAIISAEFDEPVAGVSASTFTVSDLTGAIAGSVAYNAATRIATFTPAAPLEPNRQPRVLLGPGITDLAGNPLAPTPTSWQFSTPDTQGPQRISLSPDFDQMNVPVTAKVIVQFDEPANNVSDTTFTLAAGATPIAGTVTYSVTLHRATFTPAAPLPAMTTLTASLTSGITDDIGNPLFAFSWMFTTQ